MKSILQGIRLVFVVVLVFWFSDFRSQECISVNSNNWNNTGTWLCDGVNRVPTCGDTVYITAGRTVSVTNQNNYEACGSSMVIDVSGDLAFTNGNKLELPCGSLFSIQIGGSVYKNGPGGGSSTLISICDSEIWRAADGTLNGPYSSGGSVLPIELISFHVSEFEDYYLLTWKTAAEINNDFFTLYNSDDGDEWLEILEISGAGKSNQEKTYESQVQRDETIGSYFKLQQTDFDGSFETVAYVMAQDGIDDYKPSTMVWPNPTNDIFYIDLTNYRGSIDILLYNLSGSLVYSWQASAKELTFRGSLIATGVNDGTYLLSIDDGVKREAVKITLK
ncbi:MAG: T9SS type A sorting domain-containing protein [Salibacteraceae bacterium]